MDKKAMVEAQPHIDALKAIAEKHGVSLDDLVEKCCNEMPEEDMEHEEEMGMGMPEKAGPNRGKIAMIIAKMKKAKEE